MALSSVDSFHEKVEYHPCYLHECQTRILKKRTRFNGWLFSALVISAIVYMTLIRLLVALVYSDSRRTNFALSILRNQLISHSPLHSKFETLGYSEYFMISEKSPFNEFSFGNSIKRSVDFNIFVILSIYLLLISINLLDKLFCWYDFSLPRKLKVT